MTHKEFIGKILRWFDNSVIVEPEWTIYQEAQAMYKQPEEDNFIIGYLNAVQNLVHDLEIRIAKDLVIKSGFKHEEWISAQLKTGFENEKMIEFFAEIFNQPSL